MLYQHGFVPGDGPIVPPIVGTGTFVSPIDLVAGTYDLSALSGFSVNFNFASGQTYSTANIATPLTGAAVRIVELGGGVQRLFFTEGSGPGVNGGPANGSLDLISGGETLSFEPSFFGGNFLYVETSGGYIGRYRATSVVPERATWALLIVGFAAIGGAIRSSRRRQATTVS